MFDDAVNRVCNGVNYVVAAMYRERRMAEL